MDCNNINSPNEILNAFRACDNNPAREIALFRCLATRPVPPVAALVELTRKIRLEVALALSIQALGQIAHPQIKTKLNKSVQLLQLLARQAESGESDLIRWSAATAIEEIGFEFFSVAQHLSEDPKNIARNIENSFHNRGDRFWNYGPLDKQKEQATQWREVGTLSGHKGAVSCLAISADGKNICSASGEKTITLWQTVDGSEQILAGHSEAVSALLIATLPQDSSLPENYEDLASSVEDAMPIAQAKPKGTPILISGSSDKTIKLWNLNNGEVIRTLAGHSGSVISLAIAPDGQTLFSGSIDETIKLWNLNNGEIINTFTGHQGAVGSLAVSPDGQTLFSGSWDETIKLWNLSTGQIERVMEGHSGAVNSLAISPDGQTLFSDSIDDSIKLWQISTGEELSPLSGSSTHISSLAISPNGQLVFGASIDDTIKIWLSRTGELLCSLTGHSDFVRSLAIAADSKTLVSGSNDTTIKIWQCN